MKKEILAIDIETTGLLFSDSILTIGCASRKEEKVFNVGLYDLYHNPEPFPIIWRELNRMVNEADIVAMHNASFDLMFLLRDQFLDKETIQGKLFDTLLTARMTGKRNGLGLEKLCNDYGISSNEWIDLKGGRANPLKMGVENVIRYNKLDARFTLQLAENLWKESVAMYGESFTLRESDFCRLMAEIQVRGKKMHRESTEQVLEELRQERNDLFRAVLWVNQIESPNDYTNILKFLKRVGYDLSRLRKTKTGKPSLDTNSLDTLKKSSDKRVVEIVEAIERTRKLEKIRTTYIGPFLDKFSDGQDLIHGSYHVGGTTTFRLSSDKPNMQNIPRHLHDKIWVEFLSADYSQAELRLATAYAREPKLAIAYGKGADVHSETAIALFGEATKEKRSVAKNCNFLALYAGGAKTLHERYGVPFDEAVVFVKKHRKLYPRLSIATRKAQEVWEKRGYLVLLSGKRVYASDLDLQRPYKAFNHVIQGGVAELVKESMLMLDKMGIPIIGQIHDSIEFPIEALERKEEITEIMENVLPKKISEMVDPPMKMKVDLETKGVAHD